MPEDPASPGSAKPAGPRPRPPPQPRDGPLWASRCALGAPGADGGFTYPPAPARPAMLYGPHRRTKAASSTSGTPSKSIVMSRHALSGAAKPTHPRERSRPEAFES